MRHPARLSVLLPILAVVACDDTDGGVLIPVQNQATVRFVNAIPGTSNLGFSFNGVAQGGALAFQGSTQCLRLNTSGSSFAFNTSGTTGVNRTFTQALVAGSRYTILAAGTSSNPSVIALTDESVTAATGRARVRVINATSSTAPVDVFLTAPNVALGTANSTSIGTGGSTTFLDVPAGQTQLRLTSAGTSNVTFTGTPFTLSSGEVTTLVVVPGTTAGTFQVFEVASCS